MLIYRKAYLSDIQTLRRLAREIWTASYTEMLSAAQIEYMLKWMYSAETIEKEMQEGVLWEIIEFDTNPIGYISLTPEGKKIKLNKLYLSRNIQGKGFGLEALKHIIEYSKKCGFEQLYLTVNQRNYNAMKAYEKAGFIRT